MKKSTKILTLVGIIAINFFADRISKILAVLYIKGREPISLFYNSVVVVYAENTGAFLSMGAGWMSWTKYILLLALPIVACIYGVYYIFFKEKEYIRAVLFACIIGGGLGNLYDRFFNNFSVVDFLNFGIGPVLRTGIVNLADISVTFAVLFLIVYEFNAERLKKKS